MRLSKFAVTIVLPLALVTCEGPIPHAAPGQPHDAVRGPAAPRPRIVPRSAWRANEKSVRGHPANAGDVRVVFIHHTDQRNTYGCGDVPHMLRALEAVHVRRGWNDIGYNFLVDRCGTIYEGRAGGVARPVEGAHTEGFNKHSVGIAVLGTYDGGHHVPRPVLRALASLAAWKLRPGLDPRGKAKLVSTSGESRYKKGTRAEFDAISGHRDAYGTTCPGVALYGRLPWLREEAARLRDGR
jgi:hypothetical protein